jgi:hypothetical protein
MLVRLIVQLHVEARATVFISRSLLRCVDFLLQNCAIQRRILRSGLVRFTSEKHAVQGYGKLRKNSLGNYKS